MAATLCLRCSAYTSPSACFSGKVNGSWSSSHHRTITATPSSVGLKYDEIRFDSTETGILQLDGWWIPADRSPSASTLLLLHDGSGSLSDTLPQLQTLHNLGMNIFAFDYRGFGKSVNIHPSQSKHLRGC